MVNFVEIYAAHLDAQGAVGENIHGECENGSFLAEHFQFGNNILLLVVVKQQVFAFGDDGHDLFQVYHFAFLLVFHVEVDGVDGDLHLSLFLASHAVVARHELRKSAKDVEQLNLHLEDDGVFLFEAPLTDLRLHVRHEIVLRFHQSSIYLARHVCQEARLQLRHLLSDDCIDSGLVSGFEIV